MQMLGWMNHKLESRLSGETATISDMQMIQRGGKNTQKNYTKKIFMTQTTTMVWSLTQSQTSWNVKSSAP